MKIAAVILAAGASTRFGRQNKLLARIDGQPLVERVTRGMLQHPFAECIVVTRGLDDGVAQTLAGLPVRIVENPHADRGMGTSISHGVAVLADGIDGIMIVPGDMPALPTGLIDQLLATFAACRAEAIVFPVSAAGEQRNPVIFPAALRAELARLDGHTGGKSVVAAHRAIAHTVLVDDETAFADIDTQEDLDRLGGKPACETGQ